MEDYTYDLAPGGPQVLGAHMLEVCPSIAAERPSCEIHPLSIGGRTDPVRLVFTAAPGPAVVAAMLDLGDRFRLVAERGRARRAGGGPPAAAGGAGVVEAEARLRHRRRGVAARRRPAPQRPCRAIGSEAFADLAEIAGIELLVIDDTTRIRDVANELRWNQAYYRLAGGL